MSKQRVGRTGTNRARMDLRAGLTPALLRLSPMAHIKLPITCVNCQSKGHVTWQAEGLDRTGWEVLETSQGFHEEPSRGVRGRSAIVCNACDEIQPD
jgi:hypothetical protein